METCQTVANIDLSNQLVDWSKVVFCYQLQQGDIVISQDSLLFVTPKRFQYLQPDIKVELVKKGEKWQFAISAHNYAEDVQIDFCNADVVLSDNYFVLTDGKTKYIDIISSSVNIQQLMEQITIQYVTNN